MSKTETHYTCTACGRDSSEMTVTERRHTPTAQELAASPEHAAKGHEVLKCKCGREPAWFDLLKVKVRDRT